MKINISKNLWKLIIILVLGVAVIVAAVYLLTRRPATAYQFDQVKIGSISETVSASGAVQAAQNIDLSFERSGKIVSRGAAAGDRVTAGQVLLALDNADAAAQLAQAQAALDKQLAGSRPEYLAQLEAAVAQAQANYDQTVAATDNSLHAAEAQKAAADNNLKLAQGGETSRVVEDAYENTAALLPAIQNALANDLTKADNILGVDNTFSNLKYKDLLAAQDSSQLIVAKNGYLQAKSRLQSFSNSISNLNPTDHNQMENAIASAADALSSMRDMLASLSGVLNATITSVDLSASELDALKTIVQGARADVAARTSALTDQRHAITTAKNSYVSYQIAAAKAEQDLQDLTQKITADRAASQAALDKARAVLADAKNPPRSVDLAGYRAAVAAALANYNKTIITSPIDGIVTRQDGEVGALALPNMPLVSVISDQKYQVEIYLAETDLPKVAIGDAATVTLDNIGEALNFEAHVVKIDPAATKAADGSSSYKTTLELAGADERFKSGLSASVKIKGAVKEEALLLPSRDLVQKDGQYFAMVLGANRVLEQKPVQIGLKGADGQWEILSGLQDGESVVSFSSLNK